MKCLPALLAAICFGLVPTTAAFAADTADLLISGGTIYTGADEAPFVGDVAVSGDKIVYVGPHAGAPAAMASIDAQGMIVAPGFIDVHTHPESYIRSGDAAKRLNAPWLTQGVSTIFIGVDGRGTPNVAADQAELEAQKIGTNIVSYVGFGAVREAVLGHDARAPSPDELDRMKALVAKAMCEGAIGLSAGLFYAPQSFARTEEVWRWRRKPRAAAASTTPTSATRARIPLV